MSSNAPPVSTLFISDLHLDPSRPAVTRALLDLLENRAKAADAVYILGDLFEVWVGDDDDAPLSRQVVPALKSLTGGGIPVYLIRGNRDFLIGEGFSRETGCRLLPDPSVISLYGRPVLIMHGDLLCTDDTDYQAFRAECRSETWQQAVLSKPLVERRALAARLRQDSREASGNKAEDIMDVNRQTVTRFMEEHDADLLIHGHTHRPDIHPLDGTDHPLTRIVLGDWDQHSWILEYFPDHRYQLAKTPIAR